MVKLSLLNSLVIFITISNISDAGAWPLKEKQQQIIAETSFGHMFEDDSSVKQNHLKIHFEYGLNHDNTVGFILENEFKLSLQKITQTQSKSAQTNHVIVARSTKFAPLTQQYFIRHLLWENQQQVLSVQAGLIHHQAVKRQLNSYSNYMVAVTDPNLMDPEPIITNDLALPSYSRSFNSYQIAILFGGNFNLFSKNNFYNLEINTHQIPSGLQQRKTLCKLRLDHGIYFKQDKLFLTQLESRFTNGESPVHSASASVVTKLSPNISYQIGSSFSLNKYHKNTCFVGLWLYF